MYDIKHNLINAKLVSIHIIVDMISFVFSKHGKDYCLNIQSNFDIIHDNHIVLSKSDLYIDGNSLNTINDAEYCLTSDKIEKSLFYKKRSMLRLISNECILVHIIEVNSGNINLAIKFSNNYKLIIYSNDGNELWRFFEKGNYKEPHLVCYNEGLVYE